VKVIPEFGYVAAEFGAAYGLRLTAYGVRLAAFCNNTFSSQSISMMPHGLRSLAAPASAMDGSVWGSRASA
jgi:hypothetical protein